MRIVSCSSHSPDFFSSHPLDSLVVSSEMLPPSDPRRCGELLSNLTIRVDLRRESFEV